MAKGFKHGAGGGSSLNFTVTGGTTQPASPKENTIWVNTGTTITDWVISPAQPTGTDGLVWIQTGEDSAAAFNALKKNNLTVYPTAVKQYVKSTWSGSWQEKTGKVYTGGKWVQVGKTAFELSLTSAYWSKKDTAGNGGSISVSGGKLVATLGSNTGYGAGIDVYYSQNLSMSDYKTLEFEAELSQTLDTFQIFIDSAASGGGSQKASVDLSGSNSTGKKVYTLDISGVSSGYLRFQIYRRSGGGTATVTAVRLVK